jgi:UDP-N-acetylmuramyl pentapeptide phosphotransferase/UDP-N-acetylglucosamine-1-phosphate transferase
MSAAMQLNPKSPAGGGCLIFAGFLLGAFLGIAYNQPSIGVLTGTGVGVLLALVFWLIGRGKSA